MLRSELELKQVWGSHLPVLHALAAWLQPPFAVECGCGRFSTPVMAAYCAELVTVEHDPKWAAEVRESLAGCGCRHLWVANTLPPPLDVATPRAALSPGERELLDAEYAGHAHAIGRHCLLFVDTFTAARVPAVNMLGPLADVVVIHDTEREHATGYGYGECAGLLSGLWHYSYRPEGGTPEWHAYPHTDIFSRVPLDVAAVARLAEGHAVALFGRPAPLVSLGRGPTGW